MGCAPLTVVGSHVGVPGFAGGFVGVDIFFVISGYLIIGQIDADVAAGRFSFLDFAARRALRILPAFLLVMVTCLLLVSTVFVQANYDDFSDSFFQSALMFSNHYFLAQQGYFAPSAFTRPLLHLWSLSVEEQFYLLAPLAIVTLYAATRGLASEAGERMRDIVTAVVAVASFAACIALTYGVSHNVAFYAMPTRGFEFILGGNAVVLVPALRRLSGRAVDGVALVGVVAIAFAVVSFGAGAPYPTFRAAFPVVGTTLIIACGIAAPGNIVARALSVAPMVAIGLVSYAWYLWHWPLLSFLRTTFTNADLRQCLAAAAIALLLAALTYWFLERPIRAWRRRRRPRSLPVTVAMLSACVLVGAVGFAWSRYQAPRLQPELAGLQPLGVSNALYPPPARRGLLLGDSHADGLAAPFAEHARRAGAGLTTASELSCPPLIGVDVISPFV
ncbi:MAG: acyltransferase, partial [Alphaproteobacteria bacterium]|nr:acyltransferase [Alphaproteobacteria bacterium]